MNYRKLWEQHYGPIPVDNNNIPYEIHHKDGDRNNNNIDNLECLTIYEHFQRHLGQNDLSACILIANRINNHFDGLYDKDFLSSISSRNNKQRIAKGTHNFLHGKHRETNKQIQKKLYEQGKHHFCDGQKERGKLSFVKKQHNWLMLDEVNFFDLLCSYSFYVKKKLRSGEIRSVLNTMVIQAINCRFNDVEQKNIIFRKLVEYHNVNETYMFCAQQEQYIKRRSRERTAKRLRSQIR